MSTVLQDMRYAFRTLLKQPGFTLIAIFTLALGIGANTAIFSVVNALLLRPLPFRESNRLVMIWNHGAAAAGGDRTPLAVADLLDLRAQSHSFEGIAAFQNASLNYSNGEVPMQVRGVSVQLGRDFQATDEAANGPATVIIGDQFWRTQFAADPNVVGRTINLNGVSTNIVGVMAPHLNFPRPEVQMWRALRVQQPTRRGPYFLTGVARLKPDVNIARALAD